MGIKKTLSLTPRELEMYQLGCDHSRDLTEFDREFTEIFLAKDGLKGAFYWSESKKTDIQDTE